MRHFWICGCVLFLAACAADNGAGPSAAVTPPPARQGPQFVNREPVDWTPLNPIVAIRLEGLHGTEHYSDSKDPPKDERESVELKIFPSVKSISLDAIPFANASASCAERGQDFDIQLIASPGADVSDQLTCSDYNFRRYQIAINYSTTSKLSAGTLSIDAKARLVSTSLDDSGRATDRDDYAIELHGTIQISGTTCRAVSWRHDFPEVITYFGPGASVQHKLNTLASAADTTCTIVTEKKAG
jgi:hypothetical protein